MRRKTRTKVKKGLLVSGIVVIIIFIIVAIVILIKLNKKPEISYDDVLVGKNYFSEITINMNTKEVKRDNTDSSLTEEFDISKEQENLYFSSKEEMENFLFSSSFDIKENNQIFTITNPYQTKSIIVEADEIKEQMENTETIEIADGLYVLRFYSEKLTKAMYNYYGGQDYVKKVFKDEMYIDEPINDISQTMYGETEADLKNHHSLGVISMGLDNYANIINENQNPSDVVISTIGYGINYKNEFFKNRIDKNCYNFMLENQDISETVEQGSRIAEILVDSTTSNIRIMPLVTVTKEGYISLTSILRAIKQAVDKSDVICYELINQKHEAIDLALEKAFNEDVPVCGVSSAEKENYPANHAKTIATSSIDRNFNFADYSSKGDYIDFSAPSTDVEEIFDASSVISRWSGAQYSNAHIASAIALIKTYNKQATILDVYNFLRNFCIELGEEGKDELYGYGCPNFQNLTIADIDKNNPEFKDIKYENESWEVLKQVEIKAKDNIRMKSWAITKNQDELKEEEWQNLETVTPELDVTTEITENGTYYIWIQDVAGNKNTQTIQIDKVDNKPPKIEYTINEDTLSQGYVTINVTAEDSQSGMSDSPFSWDNSTWSLENSARQIKQNGRYKVYASDKLGNISNIEVVVNSFPQEGIFEVGEGNIITDVKVSADWNGEINNNVQITLNKEFDITAWQITSLDYYIPENFVNVEPVTIQNNDNTNTNSTNTVNESLPNNVVLNTFTNTNTVAEPPTPVYAPRPEPIVIKTTLNKDIIYYLWIKNSSGEITCQTLKISKAIF